MQRINGPITGHGLLSALVRGGLPLILAVAALIQGLVIFNSLHGRDRYKDFAIFYLSALEARTGEPIYRTEFAPLEQTLGIDTGGIEQAADPPTLVLLFEPLSLLPLRPAFWVWTMINCLALALALALLLGGRSGLSPPLASAFAALVVWYPPVADGLFWGQDKMLILLALVLAMRWMEQKHDAAAGFVLAGASLCLIFPLLVGGYLILERRWNTLRYLVVGLVAGSLFTVAIFGFANSFDFLIGLAYLTRQQWLLTSHNIALSAFLSRLIWRLATPNPSLMLDLFRCTMIVLAIATIITLTVSATLIRRDMEEDPDWRVFCLWVVTALILSPSAWLHYLVILLLPFAQIARAATRGRTSRRTRHMAVASIILTCIAFYAGDRLGPNTNIWWRAALKECGFLSLLAAYVATYWFAGDGPQKSAELYQSDARTPVQFA